MGSLRICEVYGFALGPWEGHFWTFGGSWQGSWRLWSMFDEFRPPDHVGPKLVAFGIEIAFFAVWESSINLSCSWNRFSKAFGADAGQPEGHSVL